MTEASIFWPAGACARVAAACVAAGAVLLIIARSAAAGGASVVWDPLARPRREADTLFMPDLSSRRAIDAEGGFLWGHHNETSETVEGKYDFGPGRFGPAVRPRSGDDWTFVNYAQDGLIPADEFTIELWARSETGWGREPGRPVFKVWGRNEIDLRPSKSDLEVRLRVPGFSRQLRRPLGDVGLTDDGWHAFAFTLKDGAFVAYVDGREIGRFDGVPPPPEWTDDGQMGIMLGGEPHGAGDFWVSDLRISRTARAPGRHVELRSLRGELSVDASKAAPERAPLVGALHPGGTPGQTRAALHVIRTDKILTATPMRRGAPDAAHPSPGRSGRFSYDWRVCDRVFDWMKAHGVEPYISIDSTPSILGGSVGPYEGRRLEEELSSSSGFGPEPPADLDDWAAVVGDFVHHVLNEKRARVPWWGVWNEPDFGAFWNADVDRYLDLYAATARAVRGVDPKARVGGPETAGFHEKWMRPLFERCARDGLPLDFVSYHDYSGDLGSLDGARSKVDEWAKASGFEAPFPVVIGEFNWSSQNLYRTGTSRFNGGMWHIRAFGAAYTTAFLVRMSELPAFELLVYSHTTYGDPRDGGWNSTQLIGPHGEQWAPSNALAGWRAVVGPEVLAAGKDLPPGVHALATRDPGSGRLGIVLASCGFAQRRPREVTVTVEKLAPGLWEVARHSVDPANSSRWDLAEDRAEGAPANDLRRVSRESRRLRRGDALRLELELPPWSSTFIAVERTRPAGAADGDTPEKP